MPPFTGGRPPHARCTSHPSYSGKTGPRARGSTPASANMMAGSPPVPEKKIRWEVPSPAAGSCTTGGAAADDGKKLARRLALASAPRAKGRRANIAVGKGLRS